MMAFVTPNALPCGRPALSRQWVHERPRRPSGSKRFSVSATAEKSAQDPLSFEQLFLKGPVPGDRLVRTISLSGEVSCRALTCTGLVSGAARLHRTSAVATTAFGRSLACTLLLASGKKDGEQMQVEFRGSGPIKGLTTIANGLGEVRGYLGNPKVSLPLRNGQHDVSSAIGKGILAVVRSSRLAKAPYTGLVAISSGEVAEDIAQYLAESEQIPSALAAGVYVEPDGNVSAAAGFLIQLLPGASERTVELVERNVRNVGPPTDLVRSGQTAEQVVHALMQDLEPIMNLASVSPRYCCPCGVDRVKRTVCLLSSTEIRDVLEKHGMVEGKSSSIVFSLPLSVFLFIYSTFLFLTMKCDGMSLMKCEQRLANSAGKCTHCSQMRWKLYYNREEKKVQSNISMSLQYSVTAYKMEYHSKYVAYYAIPDHLKTPMHFRHYQRLLESTKDQAWRKPEQSPNYLHPRVAILSPSLVRR